ncbi:MAG: SCP2 sterol-binding domain-containing protein [Gammaproteobacteria bacterium]|nr:SCP2 sterol-binding domain-containing protein [Gammaproteobacteria bacterium]
MTEFFTAFDNRRLSSALRLLPPPARLAGPLRLVLPSRLRGYALQRLISRVLAEPLAHGSLDQLNGRRLGVEVTDLGLRWVVAIRGRCIDVLGENADADATVHGSATNLLLLASRLEDADTLFFQRHLQLTGDTELGLTVRNLLDQLPWESIPLPMRIALNRGARLARTLRAAHHGY